MLLVSLILPFLLLLGLVLVAKRPLWISATLAFALAIFLWLQVSFLESSLLIAPLLRALLLSCEVGLILLGAIAFLEYMQLEGVTASIKKALGEFTQGNLGLEALLLAWLFCGFLEGTAGFGAPAALIAPLLVSLGFHPIIAAALPLIGDSAAVPFGAVGTPVRIGFAGLSAEHAAVYGAGINVFAGLVAPLTIFYLARKTHPEKSVSLPLKRGLLLSLVAGFCFTLPAFALSWIGPEFPSLAGSLIGMLIFCYVLLRLKKKSPSLPPPQSKSTRVVMMGLVRSFSPYLWLCALLLLAKILLWKQTIALNFLGHVQSISVFQPGLIFLMAIALFALRRPQHSFGEIFALLKKAAGRLPKVLVAIFCMAALAQMLLLGFSTQSELFNFEGVTGVQSLLLVLAPIAGAIGSFVTGSATVSNLLFAPLLAQSSLILAANTSLVLGLQLVGAGAGNMISLQNLAAVQATVGLVNQERPLLKLLWWPCVLTIAVGILVGAV